MLTVTLMNDGSALLIVVLAGTFLGQAGVAAGRLATVAVFEVNAGAVDARPSTVEAVLVGIMIPEWLVHHCVSL